jgi:phage terminase Nu1 subunit (DNA packaging protein)
MAVESNKKPNVVEMAKKKRHIHLLEKLQKSQPLTSSELKELSKYESGPDEPGIVDSQEQVAKAFGVSLRTIAYWAKDGMPVTRDGRYDLKEIQAWRFILKHGDGDQSNGKPGSKKALEEWEAKYREYKALREQMRYRQEIGELVERSLIEDGLIKISLAVKRAFLALPRNIATQLVGLEPRQIEARLRERVQEIIKDFSTDRIFDQADTHTMDPEEDENFEDTPSDVTGGSAAMRKEIRKPNKQAKRKRKKTTGKTHDRTRS